MNTILNFSPFAIFIIMLGVGMNVTIKNFLEVVKDLKVLLIGLVLQMIILPTIGFLFAIFAPVDLVLKLGIILITCVPSAVTSNYLTKVVDGNVALSVSLTSISACLSFITIPLILIIIAPIMLEDASIFQELNFFKMSGALLFITTIPVLIGIFINTKFSTFTKKNRQVLLNFFFVVIFSYNICSMVFRMECDN